jgi:hypothetical protein
MATTPYLGLPLIEAAQAQKHVTHNEALGLLDSVIQLSVKGRTLLNPPLSPAEGDRWIVPAGATGAWSGHTDEVALWKDAGWRYFTPRDGWIAFVDDEGTVAYAAGGWQSFIVLTVNGAGLGMDIREEEVVCAGASVSTTIAIPARSVALAVSVRTTLAITGATSFDCGVAGDLSKFGGSLGVALGSTNIGVIGPTAYYSDTPIVLTANGGSFTGGKVRVAAQILTFAAPTA